jgi:two-component sensor histidine kinase
MNTFKPGNVAASKGSADPDCWEPTHPLELIPVFRHWSRGLLRNLVYTVIFSTLIGLALVLLSMTAHNYRSFGEFAENLWANIVIANVIGLTFHFTFFFLGRLIRRINRLPPWAALIGYTLVSTVIVQIGAFAASWIPGYGEIRTWMGNPQWYASSLVISFMVSLTMSLAWRAKLATLERAAQAARERERLQAAERAAAQANLRALQAQIEPHFLFNTLANVVSLIEPKPAVARRMLQDFIEYLRSSLAATRAQSSTLGREADLMRAYLRLIQIRMGERLRFRVDIPDALADEAFPPMLLQPLIENAIKHGLESRIEGGEVSVDAERRGDFMEITVDDSGTGFQGDAQSGTGLSNVRERLAALYGPEANLLIEGREAGGTRVRFQVPVTCLQAQAA